MKKTKTELLDRKGLEREFGIHHRIAEKGAVSGDFIPFLRIGRRVYYRRIDVENWIAARVVTSTAAADRLNT